MQDKDQYQTSIIELDKYTVAIKDRETGEVHGAGVVVSNGLILTCYHVLGDNQKREFYYKDTIDVYFPNTEIVKAADIDEGLTNSELDVAFLKIREDKTQHPPSHINIAPLSENVLFGHRFTSIGFRKSRQFEKLSAKGEIRIKTAVINEQEKSPPLIQLYSDEIEEGMSGAAVLDEETNRVVGIISEHFVSPSNGENTISLAIPVELIVKACPDLKTNNPCLLEISNFLKAIGHQSNLLYQNIDQLFVAPFEYDQISNTLDRYKAVFITGSQEYGKTFTALKLLWEYFKKGYKPIYVNEVKDCSRIIERLLNLDEGLNHHVICFEDPLGKDKYQSNPEFDRNIGNVISMNLEDTYLIITSRDDIFKEFYPIAHVDLPKLERRLVLGKKSYDYERRKDILRKLASLKKCAWFDNKETKDTILESLIDETKLPTPFAIWLFVRETKDKTNKDELIEIMIEKSKQTAISIAKDLKKMTNYEVLFLSFPFISRTFSIDFVRSKYLDLIKNKFKYLETSYDESIFDQVLDEFSSKSEIDFVDDKYDSSTKYIRFLHDSYYLALPYLLTDLRAPKLDLPSDFTKVFSLVLFELSKERDVGVINQVLYTIIRNYSSLSDSIRKIVSDLVDRILQENQLLDPALHNNLRIQNRVILDSLVSYITLYYNDLKDTHKIYFHKILLKLAYNSSASYSTCMGIASNYTKLPGHIQKILSELAQRNDGAEGVASAIAFYYTKLPGNAQKILFKLAESLETAKIIAQIIGRFYNHLPDDVRDELVLKVDSILPTENTKGLFWNGASCNISDSNITAFPISAIAASDVITIHKDLGNKIPQRSWMMYHLEVRNSQNLPIALSLICEFDGQNYFEAIFQGTNQYRFKNVLPILNHSYLRRIYFDHLKRSLNFTIQDITRQDNSSDPPESFEYPLTGGEFDFKFISHFTGILWVNKTSNIAFPIRYQVEISRLSYASHDPLLPKDQTYKPYNALIPYHDISYKNYPISFGKVQMKNNYISYVVETGIFSQRLMYTSQTASGTIQMSS